MGGKSSRQQNLYAEPTRGTLPRSYPQQRTYVQSEQDRRFQQQQQQAQLCRQIRIRNGEKGYGYDTIFKGLLDSFVVSVEVDDPYIINFGQILNFVKFCELLVSNCKNIRTISLTTKQDEKGKASEQKERLDQVKSSLEEHGITLIIEYSTTLHDREVRFNTGWVVSLGRGLDYFKPLYHRFNIGSFDLNLRQCHETTISIFHRDQMTNGSVRRSTGTRK